ncbi:MAG TPA: hypothetical protein VG737_15690, partial [Cyclobacteriaceae bacterium]|nr:hypothetical protein [Cyclobacteriaceae bacterium]
TTHSIKFSSEKEAAEKFQSTANRLLNVNEWHHFAGKLSADFRLTDKKGHSVNRLASLGDYFRINIPGPGPETGQGYDWVKIESIDDHRDPTGESEEVSFRVRPASSPLDGEKDTAHFFSDQATSTFSVVRKKRTIKASVHGRNESPNVKTRSATDKVRNALIATGAITGLAKIQWKKLIKGILDSVKGNSIG